MSNKNTPDRKREKLDEVEAMMREQDHEAARNERATALVTRVLRFWNLDLRQRLTKFYELDDERLVAIVDGGSVMLSWSATTSTSSGRWARPARWPATWSSRTGTTTWPPRPTIPTRRSRRGSTDRRRRSQNRDDDE